MVRGDIHGFFRGLRRGLGGEPFPYLWVPELHESGHGFHVHFAVGRYVPRSLIEGAWGRGFVFIKLIQGLPVGSGVRGRLGWRPGTCRSTWARGWAGRVG